MRESAHRLPDSGEALKHANNGGYWQTSATIELEALKDGVDLRETLSRARFEELNLDLFKKTLAPVEQVLSSVGGVHVAVGGVHAAVGGVHVAVGGVHVAYTTSFVRLGPVSFFLRCSQRDPPRANEAGSEGCETVEIRCA